MDNTRMIVALAAEADDTFIWQRFETLQAKMFAAGPIAVKFAYFGAERSGAVRPYVATHWATDADDMADLLPKAKAQCRCSCYVPIGDILDHALRETQQGPVQAVVIVADRFHGDLDAAMVAAEKLRAAGTRLFVLQQRRRSEDSALRALADATGGAFLSFDPHIERVAERLPGLFAAVTHFAIGGIAALEARDDDEPAALLLEQMTAATQQPGVTFK